MATKIRFARGGAKKKPFYRIVVADERAPRDGDFIEKVGIYNPLLAKDNAERLKYDAERIKYWLSTGAQPTEAIARFLRADGLYSVQPKYTPKPSSNKLSPRAKARAEAVEAGKAEAAAKAEAEKAAAEAAKNAPAEEAPAAAEEAPAAE